MPIEPGVEGVAELVVSDEDTAEALGSGDVPVLATPALVALCEKAAVAAVASQLDHGRTTVGTKVDLDHLAPTVPGRRVSARARLEEVNGRSLRFSIEASDDAGAIARGSHTRVVVDRARFLDGAVERSG